MIAMMIVLVLKLLDVLKLTSPLLRSLSSLGAVVNLETISARTIHSRKTTQIRFTKLKSGAPNLKANDTTTETNSAVKAPAEFVLLKNIPSKERKQSLLQP